MDPESGVLTRGGGQDLRIRRRRRNQEPGYTNIQRAILENDPKRLTKLLGQKTKLKLTAEDLAVALMEAISQGKVDCVPPLLAARADPNCVDEEGKTPMIVCMESKAGGNPVILRELLKAGSSPNKATFNTQQTALHLAAKKGYQVTVKVLLSSGARVDKADAAGNTPLMFAAREGHFTALKMLLEQGAQPDPANKQGETPLLLAARQGNIDCAEELLECGADADKRDVKGQTALMLALRASQMDMVELLMSYHCDVNVQSGENGKTILHWAVQSGDLKLVSQLLRMGAEPNIRDKEWETPFITALLNKRMDVLALLMRYKCNIMVTDKNFNTGLHLAAREGIPELIPQFLKAGLDCNLKTSAGQTPLMLAAFGGHLEIVSMLLSNGANPDAMDRHRATALVYAIMSKASDKAINSIVKTLIRTGCDLDQGANLIKFLKDNHLDSGKRSVNLENRFYPPVEIAFLRGRPIVFLMLLKSGCSLKDFNLEMLKHGQDWLSPKRTEFRTVLYLLKHVKVEKKRFPTLLEMCRRPALRLYKNSVFGPHVAAVNPSQDITSYLEFRELDEIEKNFQKMIATSKDDEPDKASMERTTEISPFNRFANLRSTYTLGSAQRRRTTTAGSGRKPPSESSEDDDVFRKDQDVSNGFGSAIPRRLGHSRAKTSSLDMNGRLGSNSSSENNDHQGRVGTEYWVQNQNRHIRSQPGNNNNNRSSSVTNSPLTGRRSLVTPTKKKARGLLKINSPKTPPSLENMLFASPPVKEDDQFQFNFANNKDSLLGSDGEEDDSPTRVPRSESPTSRDLRDMKSAWKSYTTPFDTWDSESLDDSISIASVNGSQSSRDTDLSDFSRGSGPTSQEPRTNGVSPKSRPTVNGFSGDRQQRTPTNGLGTPNTQRKSRIPTLRRTPTPNKSAYIVRSSHFVEVDDDRPGQFVRSKSCRK